MRNRVIFFACPLLLFSLAASPVSAQPRKFVIAVIGSSTAQGTGATPIDSSWVNLTKKYFQGLGLIDTVYNVAVGGETTYAGMPTGFVQPSGRPAPVTSSNVTMALSFNPDVVLVNFPTNDAAADYTLQETMSNLRVIYSAITAAGKIGFITTSQPRSDLSTAQKQLLKTMRDSVEAEFGINSLNFYDPIVAADSLNINPLYNFDGTHVNNGGHQLLFQVVKNTGILSGVVPLPLTLLSFTATSDNGDVLLQWTVAGETGRLSFVVQRSQDGTNFSDLATESADPTPGAATESWTDDQPFAGKSYYRVKYSDNTMTGYSRILSVDRSAAGWGIGKMIVGLGAAATQVEMLSPTTQTGMVTVFNTAGELVFRQALTMQAPSMLLEIPTAGWAAGQYFLHVATNQGNIATRAFMKF
jgi:lysophospholipase L1-like esterase